MYYVQTVHQGHADQLTIECNVSENNGELVVDIVEISCGNTFSSWIYIKQHDGSGSLGIYTSDEQILHTYTSAKTFADVAQDIEHHIDYKKIRQLFDEQKG